MKRLSVAWLCTTFAAEVRISGPSSVRFDNENGDEVAHLAAEVDESGGWQFRVRPVVEVHAAWHTHDRRDAMLTGS